MKKYLWILFVMVMPLTAFAEEAATTVVVAAPAAGPTDIWLEIIKVVGALLITGLGALFAFLIPKWVKDQNEAKLLTAAVQAIMEGAAHAEETIVQALKDKDPEWRAKARDAAIAWAISSAKDENVKTYLKLKSTEWFDVIIKSALSKWSAPATPPAPVQ